jgi:predicted ATPase
VYAVQGLSLPEEKIGQAIEQYDAVQMFVSCARRHYYQLELSPDDWHMVAEICRLVDGMPLACFSHLTN